MTRWTSRKLRWIVHSISRVAVKFRCACFHLVTQRHIESQERGREKERKVIKCDCECEWWKRRIQIITDDCVASVYTLMNRRMLAPFCLLFAAVTVAAANQCHASECWWSEVASAFHGSMKQFIFTRVNIEAKRRLSVHTLKSLSLISSSGMVRSFLHLSPVKVTGYEWQVSLVLLFFFTPYPSQVNKETMLRVSTRKTSN